MSHTLNDKKLASRLLNKHVHQIVRPQSSGISDLTHWTTRTGLSVSRVTNANGVSTIAQQRRQRRAQERQEHSRRQQEREQESCRLLSVQIKTSRKNLQKMRERIQSLKESNAAFVEEIENTESQVMNRIDSLLHRYGQYATATATINQRFGGTFKEASQQLSKFEKNLSEELQRLRKDVDVLQEGISAANRELRGLLLYKESGQLGLRKNIFNLREELERVKSRHAHEMDALTVELQTLRESTFSSWKSTLEDLRSNACTSLIQSLPPATRAAMLENIQIKQEIRRHTAELDNLRANVYALEEQNRELEATYQNAKVDRFSDQAVNILQRHMHSDKSIASTTTKEGSFQNRHIDNFKKKDGLDKSCRNATITSLLHQIRNSSSDMHRLSHTSAKSPHLRQLKQPQSRLSLASTNSLQDQYKTTTSSLPENTPAQTTRPQSPVAGWVYDALTNIGCQTDNDLHVHNAVTERFDFAVSVASLVPKMVEWTHQYSPKRY